MEYGRIKSWMHFDVGDYIELNYIDVTNKTLIAITNLDLGRNDYSYYADIFSAFYGGGTNNTKGYVLQFRSSVISLLIADDTANIIGGWLGVYYDLAKYNEKVGFFAGVHDVDNGVVKLYLNGELKDSANGSGYTPYIYDIYIGTQLYFGKWFKGNMYLIALYNTAKSDDFIKKFYNAWQYGEDMRKFIDSSTVLWLDGNSIDEDAGLWRDMSGNGNDGTIYGAKKVSNVGVIEE